MDIENFKEGKERQDSFRPVLLALLTAMLMMLAVIVAPLFREGPRMTTLVPMPGVEGFWADSVFHSMTMRQKIAQIFIYTTTPQILQDSVVGTIYHAAGGVMLPADSLFRYRRFRSLAASNELRPFMMVSDVDSIRDYPPGLSVERLLSIRSDSLILNYLSEHISTARITGATFVQYPLWVDKTHTAALPDTLLLKRQIDLSDFFVQHALEQGMVPLIPLPQIALRVASPSSPADSLIHELSAQIINESLPAVVLDSIPASLQQNEGLRFHLRKKYGFKGLIVLRKEIKSQNDFYSAISSGADLVITGEESEKLISRISDAVLNQREQQYRVNNTVLRILLYKEWLMNQQDLPKPVRRSSAERMQLHLKLETQSVIRLNDTAGIIPLAEAGSTRYLIHIPSDKDYQTFTETFGNFSDYRIKRYSNAGRLITERLITNIIILEGATAQEMQQMSIKLADAFQSGQKVVVLHFGKVEALKHIQNAPVIVHSGISSSNSQRITANFLFGGTMCEGVIPWDLTRQLRSGAGELSPERVRLNYTLPEESGIDPLSLLAIDSIVLEAIINGAFPGCQVFVAVAGNVVYHKAFGETTYSQGTKVTLKHLYDIASVTKTAATTVAMMRMYDQKRMRLNDLLGKYFIDRSIVDAQAVPDTLVKHDTIVVSTVKAKREAELSNFNYYEKLNDTLYYVIDTLLFTSTRERNVFRIPVRSMLIHRSGLPPALPIGSFLSTFDRRANINRYNEIYSPIYLKDSATILIAENMYMFNHYFDTLWSRSRAIGVNREAEYVYSDANMVFIQQAIDSLNKKPISRYLRDEFYKPLGLRSCAFRPMESYPLELIVPTAMDLRWRRQLVHGTVHDPTAALFGGVAGNAGLFSNAADLGVLHQMLLQGGTYGGRRYLEQETVALFTSRQEEGYRGLGFDRKSGENTIIAPSASMESYGHTGFTGTCVWVDPEHQIVFVFLSNRVHPNTENYKINHFKVRQRVHQVVYDALNIKE